jgi:pentose-5-phosphate-3-epimerase
LSINPGTQNAGVCAFDSTTQTIVYWNKLKLLDVHEQVIRSTDQVERYLDSITDNVTAALKSDEFWVWVEEQPWDSDCKKGIVFNLQLQQAIVMYYLCQGKTVRVLSTSERYKFLGINNWQQMTRHYRKVSTANAVRQLLGSKRVPARHGRCIGSAPVLLLQKQGRSTGWQGGGG